MIVGLTGGIGAGKSTVSKLFELLGYAVFNSDEAAKEVYFDADVKRKVIALLGPEAYLDEYHLHKNYISERVFSDTQLLHQLNGIIHPAVKDKMKSFMKEHAQQNIVKESALLFEAKLEKEVDKVIVVATDPEIAVSRVMQRDHLSREDVLKRIKSQIPVEEKQKMADYVVYNNEKQLLIPQVLHIHETLQHV